MMNRRAIPLVCVAIAVSVLWGCTARGQPPDPASQWRPLFDGKSLAGWTRLNGEAEYAVENGAIVGTTEAGSPNSFLATEGTYGDFALELEFLVDPDINSGVQVRSLSRPDYQDGRVHGYQVEIDPSERAWTAGLYDEARRGWLYPLSLNEKARAAFRPGEWNTLDVECIGDRIRTWLNGVPAADLVDAMTPEGFIALQVHAVDEKNVGKKVSWRNIRIKTGELEPREGDFPFVVNTVPNTLSERERELGWKLLWDGATTAGWRHAGGEGFPEKGWTIADGELSVDESGGAEAAHGGDIVTDGEYSAFELQLDFRLTEGANSGIKYFVTEQYKQKGGSAIGFEYQILDDERHPDARLGRDGNRTLASLYDLIPAKKDPRFVKEPGEWNHARIVVRPDGHVEHWLNNMKVLEYQKGSPEVQALIARSKYKDWKEFGLWERGHLLLQDHGNHVSFRSIKVKDLS